MAESWEDLGIPGEGTWTIGQGLSGDSGQQLLTNHCRFISMFFFSFTNGCGHTADELVSSCVYTTNFPEIAHDELVAYGYT